MLCVIPCQGLILAREKEKEASKAIMEVGNAMHEAMASIRTELADLRSALPFLTKSKKEPTPEPTPAPTPAPTPDTCRPAKSEYCRTATTTPAPTTTPKPKKMGPSFCAYCDSCGGDYPGVGGYIQSTKGKMADLYGKACTGAKLEKQTEDEGIALCCKTRAQANL